MHFMVFIALLATPSANPDLQLYEAARNRSLEGVREAFAHGANIEWQDEAGGTALFTAVADFLISKGANLEVPSKDGSGTMLMYAVMYNDLEMVKHLIAAGAKVNAMNDGGETPLGMANKCGFSEIADVLKSAGGRDYWRSGLGICAVVGVFLLGVLMFLIRRVTSRRMFGRHE